MKTRFGNSRDVMQGNAKIASRISRQDYVIVRYIDIKNIEFKELLW